MAMNEIHSASLPPSTQSGWKGRITGLVLAVVLTGIVTVLNFRIPGPIIQADEGSYLANAAAIAGFENDMASSYHAGYSVLISPAFRLAHGPDAVWKTILIINGLLYCLLCLGLWQLTGKLAPETGRPRERILPVLLASVYPMWVVMVGYSFSQLAFATAFVWATLFLLRATCSDQWRDWLIFSVLAGYTYWIHPTGLVVVIAAVLACVIHGIAFRCLARPAFTIACGALTVLAYKLLFLPWLQARMTLGGPPMVHYPDVGATLKTLLTDSATLANFLSRVSGHLFYLVIGSVGVFVLGIIELAGRMKASAATATDGRIGFQRTTSLFILLSLLGILALSALMFSTSADANRLDHWMYGRYMEGALAPLLLAGALHRKWHRLAWAVPPAALSAWALHAGMGQYNGNAPFNIPALWQQLQQGLEGIGWWCLAGSALIALAALLGRNFGRVLVIGVFCFAAWRQIDWHQNSAGNETLRWQSARQVRVHYPAGTCVGFDLASAGNEYGKRVFWFDYGFQLYDYDLRRMSIQQWAKTCNGLLFSYNPSVGSMKNGAEVVAASPKNGPTLWSSIPVPMTYPLHVSRKSLDIRQVLAAGWNDVESNHVWSTSQAMLRLPVPAECVGTRCSIRLEFNLYAASSSRPVQVTLVTPSSAGEQRDSRTYTHQGPHTLDVPFTPTGPYAEISILVPDAISPLARGESSDSRELGLSLLSVGLHKTSLPRTSNAAQSAKEPVTIDSN